MLRGERIVLRAVERDDLPAIHAMRNDAPLERLVYGTPLPHSLTELQAQYDLESQKPVPERDAIKFVIEADGAVIGRCDLFFIDRVSGTVRLGITVDGEHQGRGLGTEAVDLLIAYAFRDLGLRKVWLDVLAGNRQAIRSYEKSGFVEEGRMRAHYWFEGEYQDAVVMGILRDEWPRPGPA